MNPVAALIVYILIWWCVFFAVLPTNVRGRWEGEPDGVSGAEPGAPQDPDMKRKIARASLISFAIWLPVCAIIVSGVINFRE